MFVQELDALGFGCPYVASEGDEGNLDVVTLVNATWELVQGYRSCVKTITDLEAQVGTTLKKLYYSTSVL